MVPAKALPEGTPITILPPLRVVLAAGSRPLSCMGWLGLPRNTSSPVPSRLCRVGELCAPVGSCPGGLEPAWS